MRLRPSISLVSITEKYPQGLHVPWKTVLTCHNLTCLTSLSKTLGDGTVCDCQILCLVFSRIKLCFYYVFTLGEPITLG